MEDKGSVWEWSLRCFTSHKCWTQNKSIIALCWKEKMKKLQFDYWPILRSDDGTNPLILEGQLQDLLLTHWNNKECWPTIELSKEGYEKGSVFRSCDIDFDNKYKYPLTYLINRHG